MQGRLSLHMDMLELTAVIHGIDGAFRVSIFPTDECQKLKVSILRASGVAQGEAEERSKRLRAWKVTRTYDFQCVHLIDHHRQFKIS